MNHRRVLLSAVCLWLALAAAAEFWWTKPSEQWSRKEAQKVLFDSPWAQSGAYTLEELMPPEVLARFDFKKMKEAAKLRVQREQLANVIGVANTTAVRLRSALPVRQAYVSNRRHDVKYDRMAGADKAEFDAAAKEFIECAACAEYYVVTLDSKFVGLLREAQPDAYSPEMFKPRAFLANDKGEWRPCERVEQENQEVVFFFRRAGDNGERLINPGDKSFILTLHGEVTGGKLSPGAYWEFKVSKLTRGGRVEF